MIFRSHQKSPSDPRLVRYRLEIKQQVAALIRIANRLETATNLGVEGRKTPAAATVPAELASSQVRTLEVILEAFKYGIGLAEIQVELVSPAVEEGVTGDLAWRSIHQVMTAATAKANTLARK